jgi:hypothetical protein
VERWVRENQLNDCPFCPENWPNLYIVYMMTLPIHIGPYGMGRGDAMAPGIQEGRPHCLETDVI